MKKFIIFIFVFIILFIIMNAQPAQILDHCWEYTQYCIGKGYQTGSLAPPPQYWQSLKVSNDPQPGGTYCDFHICYCYKCGIGPDPNFTFYINNIEFSDPNCMTGPNFHFDVFKESLTAELVSKHQNDCNIHIQPCTDPLYIFCNLQTAICYEQYWCIYDDQNDGEPMMIWCGTGYCENFYKVCIDANGHITVTLLWAPDADGDCGTAVPPPWCTGGWIIHECSRYCY